MAIGELGSTVDFTQDKGGPAVPDKAFGGRVRDLRRAAGLTLAQLAERIGLSTGALSQIERGLSTMSVRTLWTLSSALQVSPAWLIDPASAREPEHIDPHVVRANRPRLVVYDSNGIRKELASPRNDGRLQGMLVTIEPGCGSGDQPYSHKGEEIALILSGNVEILIGDRTYILSEGDGFNFASSLPHKFRNVGHTRAVIYWVVAGVEGRPALRSNQA